MAGHENITSPGSVKSPSLKKNTLLDRENAPSSVLRLKEILPSKSAQKQMETLTNCLQYVLDPSNFSKPEPCELQDPNLIPGLLDLIKLVFRLPINTKPEHIKQELIQMGLDSACIELLLSQRKQILQEQPIFPRMGHEHTDMNWRLDVSLSSSYVSKIVEPSILLTLPDPDSTAKNPESIPVHLPLPVFHALRASVARALYQMQKKST